jgi:hypothetical protein
MKAINEQNHFSINTSRFCRNFHSPMYVIQISLTNAAKFELQDMFYWLMSKGNKNLK